MQDELLALLSARRGHFKLESGHHGSLWLELDRLLLQARQVRRFALALAARLARYRPAAVCGPLVGGALIAQAIAAELDVEFYYSERSERSERLVPPQKTGALYAAQYRVPASLRPRLPGKRIAVVDDVVNAGSAVRGTISELREQGAQPVVVGALLVLGSAAPAFLGAQEIPLESLASLASDLWAPDRCPLCAAHLPLEDLTSA